MKHAPADQMKKDLEILLARINALEAAARDEHQRGSVKVMRSLAEGQMHALGEIEHLKKAMDLLLSEIWKLQSRAQAGQKPR